MERLNRMGLKRAFFWLSFWCVLTGLALAGLSVWLCSEARQALDPGGMLLVTQGGVQVIPVPEASEGTRRLTQMIDVLQLVLPAALLLGALILADVLFYRLKLKAPIAALRRGAGRIMDNDLDFTLPPAGGDELGELCAAFEAMRAQLLKNNRELWRQAEERRRLNAAFSHDLRNPIAVLRGTVQLMERQGGATAEQIGQLARYTGRIGDYVEAMSGAGRLEAVPVNPRPLSFGALCRDTFETARLLAPGCACRGEGDEASLRLDPVLFAQVAENLVSNAARFAAARVEVVLALDGDAVRLTVADDGPGYPEPLLRDGPRPFERGEGEHLGMGLYICRVLCEKLGGRLTLSNRDGALARAEFPAKA